VYALGVLLFQSISGVLPFVASDAKGLMAMHLFKPPPFKRLGGDVLPAFRQLLERMLGKTPQERPSMTEVLEQLELMTNAKG
jgi:serine/threonine protein kinase